jgi:hypothetical protein
MHVILTKILNHLKQTSDVIEPIQKLMNAMQDAIEKRESAGNLDIISISLIRVLYRAYSTHISNKEKRLDSQ